MGRSEAGWPNARPTSVAVLDETSHSGAELRPVHAPDRPPSRDCGGLVPRTKPMDILLLPPLMSLLSGIAILIWPRLLNYIVAFYLILFGLVGLLGQLQMTV